MQVVGGVAHETARGLTEEIPAFPRSATPLQKLQVAAAVGEWVCAFAALSAALDFRPFMAFEFPPVSVPLGIAGFLGCYVLHGWAAFRDKAPSSGKDPLSS